MTNTTISRINPTPWANAIGYDHGQLRTSPTRFLTVAGQASTDTDGSLLHEGDVTAQLALAVANLEAVLREADMSLADVALITVYAVDVPAVHAAHEALFGPLRAAAATPPTTLVGVASLAVPGMAVALDAIAIR